MAATGGLETVQLTGNQNGTHTHDGSSLVVSTAGAHTHTYPINTTGSSASPGVNAVSNSTVDINNSTSTAGAHTHTISGSTGSSGLGSDHQNMPPAIICNYIIKL